MQWSLCRIPCRHCCQWLSAWQPSGKLMMTNFLIELIEAGKNGHHFPDDIFKWIFSNENIWILIKISLKFVPMGPINNILALVLIMAWRRPGDKPLSEPMIVSLLTHICVARPQWVKSNIDHEDRSDIDETEFYNTLLYMCSNTDPKSHYSLSLQEPIYQI